MCIPPSRKYVRLWDFLPLPTLERGSSKRERERNRGIWKSGKWEVSKCRGVKKGCLLERG